MGEQPLNAGILDLATHKACGAAYRYVARWALTPPFHPCSASGGAVIFCHVASTVADSFPLRNMVLCVARTFLLRAVTQATSRPTADFSMFRLQS